jgi:hypothetical protein
MSLSLSIVDNADGSGATATVAGSTVGTVNYVSTSAFDGESGPSGAWVATNHRTGDGTLLLDLDVGYYFAVLNNEGVLTPVTYFGVSDGMNSVYLECLRAAQARIRLLALPDVASSSVVVKKIPIDRLIKQSPSALPLPCILLTPRRETMDPKQGVTSKDDVVYQVLCSMLAADNQEPTLEANLDRQLYWRERIAKAFRNQRLPGVDSIVISSVEPQDVVVPRLWTNNVMGSGLVLKFTSREPRGIAA